jgi:type IV pilus assembly protein PilM
MAYGIDIGTSALKVVALQRGMGGWKVTGAGRKRVPKFARAEEVKPGVAKILWETMGGGEHKRVGVVGLTGRDVNLQVITQPKTTPLNYRTLMRYEVEQRTTGGDSLYADWCTLREPDAYFPQYLAMVGVGKSGYVDDRIATVSGARVEVRDAVPNAFALYALYRANYDIEGGAQLLLDVGAENIDMALVRGGKLIFARNVSTGSKAFDSNIAGLAGCSAEDAEAKKIQFGTLAPPKEGEDPREEEVRPAMRTSAGQLVGVVNSSITFAKTQLQDKELTVDKVYVSGGGARLRGLVEYLASALKTEVEILDPFRKVSAGAMESVPEFKELPSDMAVAMGLGILASSAPREGARLSIVPEVVRKRRNFLAGPLYLVFAGVVLFGALLVVTGKAWNDVRTQQNALNEFNAKNADIGRRIDDLNRVEAEQREEVAKSQLLIGHTLAGRGTLDAVAKLRRTLPEGVNIRKVEFVDLSDRPRNPLPKKRVLFHAPGRGLIVGASPKSEKPGVIVVSLPPASGTDRAVEEFSTNEVSDVKTWEAPSKGIQIEGEIDDNVKGGSGRALDAIKRELDDPSRGVSAEIPFQEASRDKPGWTVFRIVVRFE